MSSGEHSQYGNAAQGNARQTAQANSYPNYANVSVSYLQIE